MDEMKTDRSEKKKKYPIWIPIAIAFVLIIVIIAGVIVYSNSPAQRLKKQLSLGERYLSELNYEEAVAAFTAALEIDPMNEEAKEALAGAYLAWAEDAAAGGDTERALKILSEGYAATGSQAIADRLDALKARIEEREREKQAEAEAKAKAEAERAAEEEKAESETERFQLLYEAILAVEEYDVMGRPFREWDYDSYVAYIEANGESTMTGVGNPDHQSYVLEDGIGADIHPDDRIAEVFDSYENAYSQIQEGLKSFHHYGDVPSAKYPVLGMRIEDLLMQSGISMDEVGASKTVTGNGWHISISQTERGYSVISEDKDRRSIRLYTEDDLIQTILINSYR